MTEPSIADKNPVPHEGSPVPPHRISRFWNYVNILSDEDCWEWQASRRGDGYGNFAVKGVGYTASRVAWAIVNGPIPYGMHILHKCDNPPCCNPCHLFVGTNAVNVADKVAKGRATGLKGDANPARRYPELLARGERNASCLYPGIRQGSKNGCAKLDDSKVKNIRDLYRTGLWKQIELAEQFGVSQHAVSEVVLRKRWKHVP